MTILAPFEILEHCFGTIFRDSLRIPAQALLQDRSIACSPFYKNVDSSAEQLTTKRSVFWSLCEPASQWANQSARKLHTCKVGSKSGSQPMGHERRQANSRCWKFRSRSISRDLWFWWHWKTSISWQLLEIHVNRMCMLGTVVGIAYSAHKLKYDKALPLPSDQNAFILKQKVCK